MYMYILYNRHITFYSLYLYRLQLDSFEQCRLWCHRVQDGLKPSANFRDAFAFIHYAYLSDGSSAQRRQLKGTK